MEHSQHTSFSSVLTSRERRFGRRACLRKGCEFVFQPQRWNQRYCQGLECQCLVRRWQAAKRQRERRQNVQHRQRHCEAERQRRKRRREHTSSTSQKGSEQPSTNRSAETARAWSRSKNFSADFCDRVGCYDPVRCSTRTAARYCSDECRQAMRRVLDRERKWLRRNTNAGRFKRRLEYELARSHRSAKQDSLTAQGRESSTDEPSAGRHPFGFL